MGNKSSKKKKAAAKSAAKQQPEKTLPTPPTPTQNPIQKAAAITAAKKEQELNDGSSSSSSSDSDDELLDDDWLNTPSTPRNEETIPLETTTTITTTADDEESYIDNEFFEQFPPSHRKQLINALENKTYHDGDAIVLQGDVGTTFFVIKSGEAVITINEGTDQARELTHIYTGQFFGETALIYGSKRTATVRSVGTCICGVLDQIKFEQLTEVRGFLLLQKCDIIQSMNRKEQLLILSKLKPKEYNSGETVIKQGDVVNDNDDGMFIITKGELDVVDDTRGKLASIYQGHSFGEMALINDAPRAASVVAKTKTFLLCLCKSDFVKICQDSIEEGGRYFSRRVMDVVDISITPPSFKPVSLSLFRSPLSKTPKHVFF